MSKIIEVRELSKIYGVGENSVEALYKASFSIDSGELVAIVGKSGSGKSTLMNLLGCLDTPTQGEYLLNGKETAGLSARKLAQVRSSEIGFIFQGFHLLPSLTALENVELPLKYRGYKQKQRTEMAQNALSCVGLCDRLEHLPSQLSGGQQQRVAIARAIAGSPPIILADEPTGNLDTVSGAMVVDILLQLQARGHTVIIITHDTQIASIAQRVIQIKDGRIA